MKKLRIVGIQITCDSSKKEMLLKANIYREEAIKNNSGIDNSSS